jgi:hypothetical protein
MNPLAPKPAFVTLLLAAVATHGHPLASRQTKPVLERGSFDSIGNLIDEAKSRIGHATDDESRFLRIGRDDSNHTPTLPVAKDVFAELTKGALYSNAAYCSPASVKSWSCGAACEALGDINVAFTGGDGKEVPACKWESTSPNKLLLMLRN